MKAPIELSQNPWVMRRGRDFIRSVFKLSRSPFMGKRHPWLKPATTDMRWLPINRNIGLPEDVPLPGDLLDRFIDEASHRVIIDYCGCRKGKECHHYPVDIGCLFLGDAAVHVAPSISREVTADEARRHARKAMDAGLVPAVGTAKVDTVVFRVTDPGRLLTVCFCCECCCLGRLFRYVPVEFMDPVYPRLESISVTVTDACIGCGRCVDHCYLSAIEIVDGRAVHHASCRACGRCASACPQQAVNIEIGDPDFLEKTYRRIRSKVKHDG